MNVSFNKVHLIFWEREKKAIKIGVLSQQYALIDYVPDKDIKIETFVKKIVSE